MRLLSVALAAGLAIATAGPAVACRVNQPLNLNDVTQVDLVVVGTISDYEIVLDQQAREERRRQLADNPDMPAALRQALERQDSYLSDYARFTITVDEVLVGDAPRTLVVALESGASGQPPGPRLFALSAGSRGRTDTLWTVWQRPCAPPFMIEADSPDALTVRRLVE